jgi:hypothetical protein
MFDVARRPGRGYQSRCVNATAIAVAIFCLLLLGCGVFVTRMLWDDISAQLDADPEWSGWGEGLWSRLPRALPVLINGFVPESLP